MGIDRIQFVGHSCLWITLDDNHFLVDANFSQKILGILKRQSTLGIDLNDLPDVAALLVTHAHYDHLDIFSYKYFPQDKKVMMPRGIALYFTRFLHNPVLEMKEWDVVEIGPVKIAAVPVKHVGWRLSGLRYRQSLGYIFQGSKYTIYVAGDTGYGPHFKQIAEKYSIDIACLPIGAYRPAWFMKNRHMNPDEALKAFNDLKAKKMIPIHWGSFRVAFDKINEPLETLKRKIQGNAISESISILQPGESITL